MNRRYDEATSEGSSVAVGSVRPCCQRDAGTRVHLYVGPDSNGGHRWWARRDGDVETSMAAATDAGGEVHPCWARY
jgi:hypothetical protein